jgi:hypothetical protein
MPLDSKSVPNVNYYSLPSKGAIVADNDNGSDEIPVSLDLCGFLMKYY